jgi:predicted dehydrogenase
VDLIRSFFGDPTGVHALTVRHPSFPKHAGTRSTVALGYGEWKRATITANHGHVFGSRHQESYVKWEGTRGALVAKLGVNLNYPAGEPDTLELCQLGGAEPPSWRSLPVEGNWFPHAFAGSMASVMRFADGAAELPTAVEDACRTMAVVEAAYAASAAGATPIPSP